MYFRTIRDSLIDLLGSQAAGRYRVIGYQEQNQDASEIVGTDRSVQVYYSRGEFPKSAASVTGPYRHNMTFRLDMFVSAQAEGDLSVIYDPNASPAAIAAALDLMKPAAEAAEDSFNEFFDVLYQVLMAADQVDLDLTPKIIRNRWVGSVEKDEPIPRGEYVVITGATEYTCITEEKVGGLEGTAGSIQDITLEVRNLDDTLDNDKAGVFVDP